MNIIGGYVESMKRILGLNQAEKKKEGEEE